MDLVDVVVRHISGSAEVLKVVTAGQSDYMGKPEGLPKSVSLENKRIQFIHFQGQELGDLEREMKGQSQRKAQTVVANGAKDLIAFEPLDANCVGHLLQGSQTGKGSPQR